MNLGWVDISTEISKKNLKKLNENQKIGLKFWKMLHKNKSKVSKTDFRKVQNLDINEDFLLSKCTTIFFRATQQKNTIEKVFLRFLAN